MSCAKVYFVTFIYYFATVKCKIIRHMIPRIMKCAKTNPTATSNVVNMMIDDIAECPIYTYDTRGKQLPNNLKKNNTLRTKTVA